MGALAPVSPWLPEDDLLLKNSVEAGASLESLAKGAVQFSRKFTVRELQDRWHSILYDSDIAEEASLRMSEYDSSAPTLPTKLSKAGNSKEIKTLNGKRKSVRSCYYALRKRIRSEPFNSMDLSFLGAPDNGNFFVNGDETLSENCMLGDPMPNHFGLQDSNLDIIHNSYPQIPADGNPACMDDRMAQHFHNGYHHPVDGALPMQHNGISEGIPHLFGQSQCFAGNDDYGVEEMGQRKEVPSLFEADHLEANLSSTFDQINGDPEFGENQVFHSQISGSGPSFENLDYSSPLEMPIWRTVEDIASPSIPIDDSLREKDFHTGNTFDLPADSNVRDTGAPGHDVVDEIAEWNIPMSCDGSKSPLASTGNYLEELSNSLLNLNDDDLLLVDTDGKDIIDKSYYDGLSSLLLSSPKDVNQDHIPSSEPEELVPTDHLRSASDSCPVESVDKVQDVASVSASDTRLPGVDVGTICCVLNTEDPDVPSNEDVFLTIRFQPSSVSIAPRRNMKEAGNPFSGSAKNFSGNQKFSGLGSVSKQRDPENIGQPQGSSQKMDSQWRQGNAQLLPAADGGVRHESTNCDVPDGASRPPGTASGGSSQINSMNISSDTLHLRVKEEKKDIAIMRDVGRTLGESCTEKPAFGSDGYKSNEKNASGIKQESDNLAAIQDCQVSDAEGGSVNIPNSDPLLNPTTSEPEEAAVESDDDGVPYYSDIEAMVLDMDLDPDDNYSYELEVSRYQHESARKTIIRLEQGACASRERAIAAHGVLAVLYGRHSKHYIKKPEVLLGRATEDIVVDIDLGREGRANKISRRQAIINMDKGGCFHLKNLGKFPILVNDKEVAPGQRSNLTSDCFIEIKGMGFNFETNQACVKRYLDSNTKHNLALEHQV